MGHDVQQLLDRTAVPPRRTIDPATVLAEACRRDRRSRLGAVIGGPVAALVAVGGIANLVVSSPPAVEIVSPPSPVETTVPGVPPPQGIEPTPAPRWREVETMGVRVTVPSHWRVTEITAGEAFCPHGAEPTLAFDPHGTPPACSPDDVAGGPGTTPYVLVQPLGGESESRLWTAEHDGAERTSADDMRHHVFPEFGVEVHTSSHDRFDEWYPVVLSLRSVDAAECRSPVCVPPLVPDQDVRIVAEQQQRDAGQRLPFRIVNDSRATIIYGTPYRLERWDGSAWRGYDLYGMWTLPELRTGPGERSEPSTTLLPARPGWYRVVKHVDQGDREITLVSNPVQVTAPGVE